ncbi:MAG: hypothetical protein NC453_12160 [Muribaculum sp.]|nr:hypothetical protein [Muribaculum sp.]
MNLKYSEVYDNGNPPYELYQSEDGLWGLIDCKGNKLKAVFKRGENNHFHCVPWEVVSFNPDEGFELDAWYDPCEVWFNFTFDDPRYHPSEFGKYLWKNSEKTIDDYEAELKKLIPDEIHWIFDCRREVERIYEIDDEGDREDEYRAAILKFFNDNPHLHNIADYNHLLDSVMRNESVDEDMKIALWKAKVELDYNIHDFEEEIAAAEQDLHETQNMCDYFHIKEEFEGKLTRSVIRSFALMRYGTIHHNDDMMNENAIQLLELIMKVQNMQYDRDVVHRAVRATWIRYMEFDTQPLAIVHKFIARFNDENIKCDKKEHLALAQEFINNMDAIMHEMAYGDSDSAVKFVNSLTQNA